MSGLFLAILGKGPMPKLGKNDRLNIQIFLLFLNGKNRHGVGKKAAIFEWGLGRNSATR